MKLKNLAFFGVMGAILSVASANATDSSIPATDYLTTKGYVDTRDTAVKNAAVQDAVASAATGAFNAATNYTAGTIGAAIKGKQDTIDAQHQLPASSVSGLATVATTGAYSDLTGTPDIPDAQVQADWNQETTTAVDYIKNKPTLGALAAKSTVAKTDLAQGVQDSLDAADAAAPQATTYTKTETDTLLGAKANTADLGALATKSTVAKTDLAQGVQDSLDAADAAAPQATTYTKTETDTLLGAKVNTADVATSVTENGANPVTGGAVYTAVQGAITSAQTIAEHTENATSNQVVTGVTTQNGSVTGVTSTLIANANVDANAAIAPSKLDLSKGTCPSGRTCILTYNASGNYAATPLTLANDTAGN